MLEAIDRAVRHSVPKPNAVIVNFPSNPTALTAPIEFYRELVALCRRHELFILSDLAYAELYFGDTPPPSVLEVEGAKDITVEFTSMSKTYNMPGWRMGFAAGNPRLIAALARVKSYLDYGAFTPIQVAFMLRAGMCRRQRLPCSYGRQSPSVSGIWARSGFPSCCWKRRRSRWRPALALVSMVMNMCALRWWKIATASARLCVASKPSWVATMPRRRMLLLTW
jgi:hypothetical protein